MNSQNREKGTEAANETDQLVINFDAEIQKFALISSKSSFSVLFSFKLKVNKSKEWFSSLQTLKKALLIIICIKYCLIKPRIKNFLFMSLLRSRLRAKHAVECERNVFLLNNGGFMELLSRISE